MDSSLFGYSPEEFKEEAKELLERAEEIIASLRANPEDSGGINALFRAIHSLKGSSAYVGLKDVTDFSHLYENFLGDLRTRKYSIDDDILAALVRSRDYLEDLIFQPQTTEVLKIDPSVRDSREKMLKALNSKKTTDGAPSTPLAAALPAGEKKKEPAKTADAEDVIKITLMQSLKNLYAALSKESADRKELLRIIEKLEETIVWAFGEDLSGALVPIEEMKGILSAPAFGQAEVLKLKKGYNILSPVIAKELAATEYEEGEKMPPETKPAEPPEAGRLRGASREEIIRMTVTRNLDSLAAFLKEKALDAVGIKGVLRRMSDLNRWAFNDSEEISLTISDIENMLFKSPSLKELAEKASLLGALFSAMTGEAKSPEAARPAPAQTAAKPVVEGKAAEARISTLRVRSEDLDSLLNAVSSVRGVDARELEKLHSTALQLRMVPVGELFNRFKKIVRDLAEELGKPLNLQIAGESVKLDKAIADKLAEPLLHMVRNAAGHGIESPQERKRLGKGAPLIKLNAYQEGGQIIIDVSDNGRGISLDTIKKRGLELGLVREEERLTEKRILDLIFTPGFTTKTGADRVSGRGVGMDVVREAVASVQGSVSVETKKNVGTTFRLRLPLTLAIIKAMVLEQSGKKIAVPAAMVDRVIGMTEKELETATFIDKNRPALYLQEEGEVIPLVNFSALFGLKKAGERRCLVLLKTGGAHKIALVVDSAVGRHPLTVKPLDRFAETRYFSSASFLEDDLVLILNVPSLMAA